MQCCLFSNCTISSYIFPHGFGHGTQDCKITCPFQAKCVHVRTFYHAADKIRLAMLSVIYLFTGRHGYIGAIYRIWRDMIVLMCAQ